MCPRVVTRQTHGAFALRGDVARLQKSTGVVSLSRSAREAVLKRDGVGCVARGLAFWGKTAAQAVDTNFGKRTDDEIRTAAEASGSEARNAKPASVSLRRWKASRVVKAVRSHEHAVATILVAASGNCSVKAERFGASCMHRRGAATTGMSEARLYGT